MARNLDYCTLVKSEASEAMKQFSPFFSKYTHREKHGKRPTCFTCFTNQSKQSTAAKLATQHGVSFTRRNTPTNKNVLRINSDAVVGMARVGVVRNLFESPKIERDKSLEYYLCNNSTEYLFFRTQSPFKTALQILSCKHIPETN